MSKFNEDFEFIKCALSTDNHFSREPIVLTGCSHSVLTERDLKNDKESAQTKKLINLSLEELYQVVEKQTSELLHKFKEIADLNTEKVELHIKYIEEEVEIRIESIKAKLDDIHEKIKKDLLTIKDNFIEPFYETEIHEKNLDQLRQDLLKKDEYIEAKFYEHQDNCIKLNEGLNQLKNFFFELKLQEPEHRLSTKNLIGDLEYFQKYFYKDDDGYDKCEAKFRYTINEFSKFKDSSENRFSSIYTVAGIPWKLAVKINEKDGAKVLSIYMYCDKVDLSDEWSIPARVQFKLLNLASANNFLTYTLNHTFNKEASNRGFLKFTTLKKIIDEKTGFYNETDDSITFEVTLTINESN